MSDWNPTLYMKFEDERMRAARDLFAQVPLALAGLVFDLGCGPGNSAELLAHRFPDARIVGLDTSELHARTRARPAPKARFVKQDIATWEPNEQPALIFANVALHFLPDHALCASRLLSGTGRPIGGPDAEQCPRVFACADAYGRRRRGLGHPVSCRSPRRSR